VCVCVCVCTRARARSLSRSRSRSLSRSAVVYGTCKKKPCQALASLRCPTPEVMPPPPKNYYNHLLPVPAPPLCTVLYSCTLSVHTHAHTHTRTHAHTHTHKTTVRLMYSSKEKYGSKEPKPYRGRWQVSRARPQR
jgi:hypothetical protein